MAEIRLQHTENPYNGTYPTVFKKIDISDIGVSPFQVYKSWTIVSGSITSSLLPLQGIYSNVLPDLDTELTYNDASNIDGSLQSVIYYSINHLFYKYRTQPINTFGPNDVNKTKKGLFQTASVFSIPQVKIGEGIKPASFTFTSSVSGSYSSDRYGNIINTAFNTSSIVTDVKFYEGFNEYFDTSRITYNSEGVSYIPGITTTTVQKRSLGHAAKFDGSGYIKQSIDGNYDRDHNYAISFFISGANATTSNQLILAKASSSLSPVYPFKIELSGSNQLIFSAAGSTTFKAQITSSIVVTGSWYHVTCQKVNNTLAMFINGTLHSAVTSSLLQRSSSPFTASARIDNFDSLSIGGYSATSFNLQGCIDEIRIFNKSLTNTQVTNLANRSEGGSALQTQYVGNVFGQQGIIIFSSPDYRVNDLLKTPYTASYRSTKTLYEMNVVTRLDSGDFNMSLNPTITQDNNETYLPFASSSVFAPYITTIGLYDNFGQLLAIGKLAQPIRKRNDVDMNFLIRLDLDKDITFKG